MKSAQLTARARGRVVHTQGFALPGEAQYDLEAEAEEDRRSVQRGVVDLMREDQTVS